MLCLVNYSYFSVLKILEFADTEVKNVSLLGDQVCFYFRLTDVAHLVCEVYFVLTCLNPEGKMTYVSETIP